MFFTKIKSRNYICYLNPWHNITGMGGTTCSGITGTSCSGMSGTLYSGMTC